jgi:hypothetical protein
MGVRQISLPIGDGKKEWMLSKREKSSLYKENFALLPYLSFAPTLQSKLTFKVNDYVQKYT